MKVATFNVNSIRKRIDAVNQWLARHQPDVLCLQETKVTDDQFPKEAFAETGYHVTFRGMKAYNGVATFTREKPERIVHGLVEGPDSEDFRILQTVVNGIPVINTYIPQGYAWGTDKFAYKLKWFERLRAYFQTHLDPQKPAIWLGDLNVAPEPMDVYDPVGLATSPDFHPEARAAFKRTADWGFVDLFRRVHPNRVQYTYWDFFHDRFARNRGWRIDHIMVTESLAKRCTQIEVDTEPRSAPGPSDHTVLWAEFNLQN